MAAAGREIDVCDQLFGNAGGGERERRRKGRGDSEKTDRHGMQLRDSYKVMQAVHHTHCSIAAAWEDKVGKGRRGKVGEER